MRMKKKKNYESKEEFLKDNFIKCKYCGYNNEKNRFQNFGKCLCCDEILDSRVFYIKKLKKQLHV